MSTKEISAAAQALGRRGGMKSLGAKSKAELSAFGKAAAQKRWAAFDAGRQAGEKVAENFVNEGLAVGGMFSAGAQQIEALTGAVVLKGAAVKAEPQKPKRSNNERTLAAVAACEQLEPNGSTSDDIHRRHQNDVKALGGSDWMTFVEVKNALSSLRSKGKVKTVKLPGSRREKLWRLA